MDAEEIENLRVVFNKEHAKENPIPKGDWKTVWAELQKRFHSQCEKGRMECIAAHMMKKPDAPPSWEKNPEEWLSSLDIDAIEKEYMKVFPKYHFVGCVPIDFDKKSKTGSCVVSALCSMDIKGLYDKGYDKIGIVFNTDVSTGLVNTGLLCLLIWIPSLSMLVSHILIPILTLLRLKFKD